MNKSNKYRDRDPLNATDRVASDSFLRFCDMIFRSTKASSFEQKVLFFAEYLIQLPADRDIRRAVRFAGNGASPRMPKQKAVVGSRTVTVTAAGFCEIDLDKVYKPCRAATGSTVETIEKLLFNMPAAAEKRYPDTAVMSLSDVVAVCNELESARTGEHKKLILQHCMRSMSAWEIRCLLHIFGMEASQYRIDPQVTGAAIARAFDVNPEDVHRAHMLTGSMEGAAVLAKQHNLASASYRKWQPIPFMLPETVNSEDMLSQNVLPHRLPEISEWVAGELPDGMRCQLHITPGKTVLFSDDMRNISGQFPDVIQMFSYTESSLPEHSHSAQSGSSVHPRMQEDASEQHYVVIDGVICAFDHATPLPYYHLQKRLDVSNPDTDAVSEHPVRFIANDLLFLNGQLIIDQPQEYRRKLLVEVARLNEIPCTQFFKIPSHEDLIRLLRTSTESGRKELLLLHRRSTYQYGRRSSSMIVVKRPGGSLKVVIMYAHSDGINTTNPRSIPASSQFTAFTIGVRVVEDDRFEESFIPIGKIDCGFSGSDLAKLTERARGLVVERFGPVRSLMPEIVVSVQFNDIRINRRTKAGLSLHEPRFNTIHPDVLPSGCNTLEDVEEMMKTRI